MINNNEVPPIVIDVEELEKGKMQLSDFGKFGKLNHISFCSSKVSEKAGTGTETSLLERKPTSFCKSTQLPGRTHVTTQK